MGSDAHVLVVTSRDHPDPSILLATAWARIDELEDRWSRFKPDSEVTAVNRCAGAPVIVSPDTYTLVEHAVAAWELTGGRFDPTIGAALIAHGYDRDFAEIAHGTATRGPATTAPAPGLGGTWLDPELTAVTLPSGVTFDPGGIGKGLAADLVTEALVDAGAAGALVNLGGDLRARGDAPDVDGWSIGVPDPVHPDDELARFVLPHGAVATSSRLLRRWDGAGGAAHHLIDPTTGSPARTDVAAVTVVADEAWWAEALAKALFLAGPDELDHHPDVHAVVVTADGDRHATPALAEALR